MTKVSGISDLNGWFKRFDKRFVSAMPNPMSTVPESMTAGDDFLNRVENRVRQRGHNYLLNLFPNLVPFLNWKYDVT